MQSKGLAPGSRVRVLVECIGDTAEGVELKLPPGALGTIDRIDLFDNAQGVAITVVLDDGIVNVFDQEDGPLGGFLELQHPGRKTCGDCVHSCRCCALFGHVAADTYCDFSPSRFRARPEAAQAEAA